MKKRTKLWLTGTTTLAIAGTAAATWLVRAPDHFTFTKTGIGSYYETLRIVYPSDWMEAPEETDNEPRAEVFVVTLTPRARSPLLAWLSAHIFHFSDAPGQKPEIVVQLFTDIPAGNPKDVAATLSDEFGKVTVSKCKVGTAISGERPLPSCSTFVRTSCLCAPPEASMICNRVIVTGTAGNKDKAATFRAVDDIVSHLELIPEQPASAH